ncbi:MAG: cell envelope integrity protein TolA, partial [Methylobacter sp.]
AEQAEAAKVKAAAEKAAAEKAAAAKEKAAAEQAEAARMKAEHDKQDMAEASAAIKQKVNRSWIRPVSATMGMTCKIRVRLMSDGTVVDAVVISSSGDDFFDRSAENAVNKASPLPVPTDKELFAREFRSFEFVFNPK